MCVCVSYLHQHRHGSIYQDDEEKFHPPFEWDTNNLQQSEKIIISFNVIVRNVPKTHLWTDSHPNRLCVFLVYQMHILLLESCRWLEQGWTWWTSQKYIHSLQTAQTALGSDHVGGKKRKKTQINSEEDKELHKKGSFKAVNVLQFL